MEGPGRIVVVSADVGAGHEPAAAELTRRLSGRGFVVDRLNLLDLLPRPNGHNSTSAPPGGAPDRMTAVHRACREAYRGAARWLPWGYAMLFALTSRSRLSVSVLRGLLRPIRRRMRRAIPADTRAVVTTYPFANQILGPLRRQGRLAVPLITYVTDSAVHPAWLAPGVDLYCAVRHAEVPPAGSDGVDLTVVQPLVSPVGDRVAGVGTARPGHSVRPGLADPDADLTGVVAEAASRAGIAGAEERGRPALVDSVGDAVAVVAAVLQSVGPR
ncbi:MGDG synthase family glycosyltransferase [Micromonospora sp. SL1-18]|uniref:MGDG synthase family glycosyltransferase n=1 Tax=Micromonospora sp. SL1-18 TaxID=3399128 RepID=UPI003A4D5346